MLAVLTIISTSLKDTNFICGIGLSCCTYLLSMVYNPFLLNCANEVRSRSKCFYLREGATVGVPQRSKFWSHQDRTNLRGKEEKVSGFSEKGAWNPDALWLRLQLSTSEEWGGVGGMVPRVWADDKWEQGTQRMHQAERLFWKLYLLWLRGSWKAITFSCLEKEHSAVNHRKNAWMREEETLVQVSK